MLTGISLATAFGLLVAMMLVVAVVRLASERLAPSTEADSESRGRAAAAVAAVTTLLADPDRARSRRGDSTDGDG